MSAIVGIFGPRASTPRDATVRRMLERMRSRARGRNEIWRGSGALLAVARHDWEFGPSFSGRILVAQDGDVAVAADASLYYRQTLTRALAARSVVPAGDTSSHLILAAYRAWGDDCVRHLEGDFAFIVWDATRRRVFCARDYGGTRPLHYAALGDTLVVASTPGAILAHAECPTELNLLKIAEAAAGFFTLSDQTAFRAVAALPAARKLTWQGTSGVVRLARAWEPPRIDHTAGIPFDAAAEELCALLREAVSERMAVEEPTAIQLSGGYDSSAVFAAAEAVRRDRRAGLHLCPVSVSYPPGDPGREDELITDIARYWSVPVHWLDIQRIPFFDRPEGRAVARDEPYSHPFESVNRALADGTRCVGAHVAFDGKGGDELFNGTTVGLADLFRQGRLGSLAREWRARGMTGAGFRSFFRVAVTPNLPPTLLDIAEHVRGRRLFSLFEFTLPAWMKGQLPAAQDLERADQQLTAHAPYTSCTAREQYWYLEHPFVARMAETMSRLALEHDTEVRSPLWDERIIRFAVTRPPEERSSGRENKRLLRHAMRGLLPAQVLAPRPRRTGVATGYFDRSMRSTFRKYVVGVLEGPLVLADLGIVEPGILRSSLARYLGGAGGPLGLELYLTLHAELWTRARLAGHTQDDSEVVQRPRRLGVRESPAVPVS